MTNQARYCVVVANGHLWDKKIPAVGTGFMGRSIRSDSYGNTCDIEGRVLMVGFGNSGCDLAVDAAQSRVDVTIAMHCGQVFQPKTPFGLPRAAPTARPSCLNWSEIFSVADGLRDFPRWEIAKKIRGIWPSINLSSEWVMSSLAVTRTYG